MIESWQSQFTVPYALIVATLIGRQRKGDVKLFLMGSLCRSGSGRTGILSPIQGITVSDSSPKLRQRLSRPEGTCYSNECNQSHNSKGVNREGREKLDLKRKTRRGHVEFVKRYAWLVQQIHHSAGGSVCQHYPAAASKLGCNWPESAFFSNLPRELSHLFRADN